jgi:indolepyruvate ferredoxin oxidoreductase
MSAKDEFEVARLYTDGAFQRQLAENFEGDLRIELHLSPNIPLLQRKNDFGGSRKWTFGPWMFSAMKILARLKWLRGSWFDVTRLNHDRFAERKILTDYEALADEMIARLTPQNHATAVALACIPEKIRGFGYIKARHIALAQAEEARLLEEFRATKAPAKVAAE